MKTGPEELRILTITPNPSLDLLFETDRLAWDDANRMPDPRRRPGGQGINVARAVRELGGSALAVTLIGGRTGAELMAMLAQEGTIVRAVESDDDTRTFVAVRERDTGRSLLLNARGPDRTPADAERLTELVRLAIVDFAPDWVACCGSLPRAFPPGFYATLAREARAAGARVVVDCDGPALASAAPWCDLLVPNGHEAARLAGTGVASVADALRVARRIADDSRRDSRCVAITLGRAGAVMWSGGRGYHARARELDSGSAVGAGDAFLAGLLLQDDLTGAPHQALCRGVAAGTAVLQSVGSDLLRLDVTETELDNVVWQELE